MADSLSRSLVSERVFRGLIEDLLAGRYAPGELLPPQRTLAASLEVNIASVREAIKRLEQLRLVESRQGDGMRVLDWREHGGLDVLAHLLVRSPLRGNALASVLEARRTMLVAAARLAAERRDADQAERLAEVAGRIAASDSPDETQSLDFAFFNELVDASGNLVFTLITNSIREAYLAHAELFKPLVADRLALVPSYLAAARAIEARDGDAAARAVQRLCEAQERRLVAALG